MLIAGYFQAAGVLVIATIALVVATAFMSETHARMRALDWAFVGVGGYELAALLLTSYRANSIWYAEIVALAVLLYFVVRLAIWRAWQTLVIAAIVGMGGACVAGMAIYQFVSNAAAMRHVGFSGIVPFRARLISPSSFILLTLPFSCALPLWLWSRGKRPWTLIASFASIGITIALCLSCSRGVFWSLVLFCTLTAGLAAIYGLFPARTALLLVFALLGTVGVLLALENTVYPGVAQAYTGGHGSQVRSIEGRIAIWKRSLALFRDHPVWGVGAGNSPLYLNSVEEQDETVGFSSRTFSLPLQLLTEKGTIGVLVYAAVILLVFWEVHRQLRRVDLPVSERLVVCCLLSGLVAVLARELTYSSLLEQMPVALLTASAIGLVWVPESTTVDPGERPGSALRIEWVAIVFAVAAGYGYLITGEHERGDVQLRAFYSRMLAADFTGARRSIDRATKLWPENARYHVWRGYCLSQLLPPQCAREPAAIAGAAAEFRTALKLNNRDGVAHHDLAWLEHLAGNDSEARKEWQLAVEIDPDNAVFHLSLGMFLQEAGDGQGAAGHFAIAAQISPAVLESPLFARHPDWAKRTVERCIRETEGRLRNSSDPVLKARLGKYYLVTNDLPRAARMLQDAATDLPNLPLLWFNLGEVYRRQGDASQGLNCYERARFLDGRLPGPHLRIGEIDQSGRAGEELLLATQEWARMNPVTAAHNNRLYHGTVQQIDDLLPTTLVWYVSPCDASSAYGALAKLFPSNKSYALKSRACEEIPDPHRF